MNDYLKYGLSVLAGIAIGALCANAVSKGKLKPYASDLMSRGLEIKDALVGKVEALKEDAEDLLAAAKQKAELRKGEQVENS
ncbi:MAG: hypothetical protein IJS54_05535 [Desulfovibrio sp.]|nr:hypothetical protein [Desulfovibrio sp.]